MTTSGPFVIIYPARVTGDPAVVPVLHPALNPAGIPFTLIEGIRVANALPVTVAVALDYPGRESA
jgi:hypothetical protein